LKYNIKYPKTIYSLQDNKVIHEESNSLVTDYSEILILGISVYENDTDIIVEGNIGEAYEVMVTPTISIEFIN
jgi:hypothetical protein